MKWIEQLRVRAGAYGGLLAALPFLLALLGWTAATHDPTRPVLAAGAPAAPELRAAPPSPTGGGVLLDVALPARAPLPRPTFTRAGRAQGTAAPRAARTLAELGRRQTDGG
ncbi:hypothetical protein [Deinococcus maricopensis]|uniref:Uncharacterized protein n=1 Tax=Deinococcus maricopensis (strain DSM 21211 / LMG 22137 / NRRL B-23946 / LB-34) TaxID=709986 RepID=E8U9G3_DEIML|nr:hypothetical protein [Deinococcus maricopensis]ADV67702.1 hypothetical protein Deima_2059 [Deinococcus maricopensis DSM 21211]